MEVLVNRLLHLLPRLSFLLDLEEGEKIKIEKNDYVITFYLVYLYKKQP